MPAAPISAAKLAAVLGGAHRSGSWWSCRCPAHHDRNPSLSIRDGDHGLIVCCWAGCDLRDVLAELRRRGLLGGNHDGQPVRVTVRGRDNRGRTEDAGRIAIARRIWNAAQDARGTPVVGYLAGRGIIMPTPPTLRYVPALRRPDGTSGPAMVARIDSVDGELIGVSRTWLGRDAAGIWRRSDRAMLGRAAGGAVRLAPAAETLMVGEGVETCLAAIQATAMPAWAALSTSGMIALVLPPIVGAVTILADNDPNGAGVRAARAAAQRWLSEGRQVRIPIPAEPGTDFNDVLLTGEKASRDAA